MSNFIKSLEIRNCPYCGKFHKYKLNLLLKPAKLDNLKKEVCSGLFIISENKQNFLKYFECLDTKQLYKHSFDISSPFGYFIKGIEILGQWQDGDEESDVNDLKKPEFISTDENDLEDDKLPSNIEILEIQNCPSCNETHRFKIAVERLEIKASITQIYTPPKGFEKQFKNVRNFTRVFTCPKTNENFEYSFDLDDDYENKVREVEVLDSIAFNSDKRKVDFSTQIPKEKTAVSLSIQDSTILEAGKKIFLNSIETSRDFSKSMITICSAIIPSYLAILGLLGFNSGLKFHDNKFNFLIAIPPLLLLSLLIYMLAYSPKSSRYTLDIIKDVHLSINKIIKKRDRLNFLASIFFLIALFLMILNFSVFLLKFY